MYTKSVLVTVVFLHIAKYVESKKELDKCLLETPGRKKSKKEERKEARKEGRKPGSKEGKQMKPE